MGLKRSGKSYILNHILGIEKAFKEKHQKNDSKDCGKTLISFFSEPLVIEKYGQSFEIYIIDSEGFYPEKNQ